MHLEQVREAMLAHPCGEFHNDAFFCRMLAIMTISYLEHGLDAWQQEENLDGLDAYFRTRGTAHERAAALGRALENAGVEVNGRVIDDLVAVKLLRNAIVHGDWNKREDDRRWVQERGFPGDVRDLGFHHWRRIQEVKRDIETYVCAAMLGVGQLPRGEDIRDVECTVLTREDLGGVFGWNLGRIRTRSLRAVDAAAIACLDPDVVADRDEQLYLLWEASRRDPGIFEQERGLVDLAVLSWNHVCSLVLEPAKITDARRLEAAAGVIEELRATSHAWLPLLAGDDPKLVEMLLREALSEAPGARRDEIESALALGRGVRDHFSDPSPCDLLAVVLPILAPDRTLELHEMAAVPMAA
jgi:hypothetical protein